MVEFMDEDELLAEFHAAGIFTDDERAKFEREVEQRRQYRAFEQQMMGIGDSHLAMMQRSLFGNPAFAEHTQRLLAQQSQRRPQTLASLLGGGFGGLGL